MDLLATICGNSCVLLEADHEGEESATAATSVVPDSESVLSMQVESDAPKKISKHKEWENKVRRMRTALKTRPKMTRRFLERACQSCDAFVCGYVGVNLVRPCRSSFER